MARHTDPTSVHEFEESERASASGEALGDADR